MNYNSILKEIQSLASHKVTLVTVSKKRPLDSILEAYHQGCRDFGENRVDEALDKIDKAPNDIRWHFIGTLQTKKVPKVIGKFSLIHSVDSFKLAEKISICSQNQGVKTPILLQANTSGESSKHGLTPSEWKECFTELLNCDGIVIQGLMTMAPFTDDEQVLRRCFRGLKALRDELQEKCHYSLEHLSMGMSNDYPIAIQEGATLVRIGTSIYEDTTRNSQ